jgi:hypothetical protein
VLIAKRSTSANPRLTASVEYSCEEYLRRRNIVAKYRFAHHGLCAQQFASRCREASFIDCGDEGTKLIERDTVQHEPTLRAIDHADGNSRNIPVIPDLDQVSMSPWDAKGGHRLVPTVGFDLLYGLVIVRLDRRDLIWIDVTANPMAEWVRVRSRRHFLGMRLRTTSSAIATESVAPSHTPIARHGHSGQAYCTGLTWPNG